MRIQNLITKRTLITAVCALALMLGLSACARNSEPESVGSEELDLRYSDLTTVSDIQWPETAQEYAIVSVAVPSLSDAYQMARSDPGYSEETVSELLHSYLEKTVQTIQLSVPAAMTGEEWVLDEAIMDRLLQEYTALDTSAFLEAAFADLEPLEINLEWGDAG